MQNFTGTLIVDGIGVALAAFGFLHPCRVGYVSSHKWMPKRITDAVPITSLIATALAMCGNQLGEWRALFGLDTGDAEHRHSH